MRKVNTIPEIKAELLLNNLYPEAGSQWSVQNEGIFYRNYNSDLLSIDEEKMEPGIRLLSDIIRKQL